MATVLFINCVFSWRNPKHIQTPSSHSLLHSSLENETLRTRAAAVSKGTGFVIGENEKHSTLLLNRRTFLASGVSVLGFPRESLAEVKQGPLAGRIPGLSEPDEQGSYPFFFPTVACHRHGTYLFKNH